jgi:NADH-ubiquinone oxidoreductase chain 6
MTDLLLTSLSVAILGSSVLVVTATSPVVSVLYVVALFLLSAGYMILAGLPFVGLVYLVVYVGAIAVLFLFVVMMLNVPLSAYSKSDQVRSVPLVAMLASLFMLSFVTASDLSTGVIDASSTVADMSTTSLNQAQALASDLFTHGALLLIVVSIVLLLAMVGPVSMSMSHDADGLKQLKDASRTL